eukprot:13795598-Heterocapsa_arctica.AAC.1
MANGANKGGLPDAPPGLGSSSETPSPHGTSTSTTNAANKNLSSPHAEPKGGNKWEHQPGNNDPSSGARSSGTGRDNQGPAERSWVPKLIKDKLGRTWSSRGPAGDHYI